MLNVFDLLSQVAEEECLWKGRKKEKTQHGIYIVCLDQGLLCVKCQFLGACMLATQRGISLEIILLSLNFRMREKASPTCFIVQFVQLPAPEISAASIVIFCPQSN